MKVLKSTYWNQNTESKYWDQNIEPRYWNQNIEVKGLKSKCWNQNTEVKILKKVLKSKYWGQNLEVKIVRSMFWNQDRSWKYHRILTNAWNFTCVLFVRYVDLKAMRHWLVIAMMIPKLEQQPILELSRFVMVRTMIVIFW